MMAANYDNIVYASVFGQCVITLARGHRRSLLQCQLCVLLYIKYFANLDTNERRTRKDTA